MRHILGNLLSFSLSLGVRGQGAVKTSFCFCFSESCRKMSYATQPHGSEFTTSYSVYLKNENGIISPFHDIPLYADKENQIFNMVVEIPRWTNAKMEISTKDLMNPIKQDVKKGKVRFVNNVFPYKGYIWNYGAIPQTWEDPAVVDSHTNQKGDGDPIDVVEIGYKVAKRGEVKQVKVLGIMALIDEGETDWKVIAVDASDPMASKLTDVSDIRKLMPGLLEATHDWFKVYKMPTGAPPNQFAFSGEAKDRRFAVDIIMESHNQWKKLIHKQRDNEEGISCDNVAVDDSPYKIPAEKANACTKALPALDKPAALPEDVDDVHYVQRPPK